MKKPVLILQHQTPETPAYLDTWLSERGIDCEIYNAAIEEFPTSIDAYSALAVMGGGMSANDPLPSNRQAEILILQAMYRDIPVIGHCLGGQLMSRALGGTVGESPRPEIGWQPIDYVDHPLTQTWFGNDPTDTVIHWHYESFSIPAGATLLASSPACPNQAFAIGKHLAMQFHIEINEQKIDSWVSEDDLKWIAARALYESAQDRDSIINGITPYLKQHKATADRIYTHWVSTTEWAQPG